jgi:hypothetical protein
MKLLSSPKSIPIRLLSLLFSLWLGGIGCLAGCARVLFDANTAQGSAHACCHQIKQKTDEAAANSISGAMNAMSCCPLAGQKCAFISKQHLPETAAVQSTQPLPCFQSVTAGDSVFSFNRIRLPDRGEIYLRHCTFLI